LNCFEIEREAQGSAWTRLRMDQGAYQSRTYRFRLSTRRQSSRRVKGGASSRDGGVVELLVGGSGCHDALAKVEEVLRREERIGEEGC
jgi:hypothetical protein